WNKATRASTSRCVPSSAAWRSTAIARARSSRRSSASSCCSIRTPPTPPNRSSPIRRDARCDPVPRVTAPPAALAALSARADTALARVLPPADEPPIDLHRAMRYAVLGGGKRLRPVLVYAVGEALGAAADALDASAAAVEIIHAYSLVHDDLPAMDDDALRRGRPTCHVAFGEAMAILAGDALQALAFEVLAADRVADAGIHVEMLRTLGAACGSHGMAGGQALDLAAVGTRLTAQELERM